MNLVLARRYDFGDTCASVVHRQQQRVVAAPKPLLLVERCEDRFYFFATQIIANLCICSLKWNSQDTCCCSYALRIAENNESVKGPDRGQPQIAGNNGVFPFFLDAVEKGKHGGCI